LNSLNIVAITGTDLSQLRDNLPDEVRSRIKFIWCKNTKEANEFLPDAEILLTMGRLDPDIMERTPKLRWVQSLSAGIDNLPLEAFIKRNIIVTNGKGVHTVQMSEFTIGVMLQWVRNTNKFLKHQHEKLWDSKLSFDELYGKTVGILGAGAIGEAVARKCQAFDMRVIGFNRSGAAQPHFNEILSGDNGLITLLQKSDFIVLLLPSTSKTHHLIKREQFQQMKPSAFLINIARGDVIDEEALIEALQNGTISGAALDVFEQEPLPETSPFWTMDNVILTPHIAGATDHYIERAAPIFYHNLKQYIAGQPLMNVVNLREGY
jgi:phosphoglycerate dehydrogenase-like enzyme